MTINLCRIRDSNYNLRSVDNGEYIKKVIQFTASLLPTFRADFFKFYVF